MPAPKPPTRADLIRALRRARDKLAWAGSQLTVPGSVRMKLLRQAQAIARLLARLKNGKNGN